MKEKIIRAVTLTYGYKVEFESEQAAEEFEKKTYDNDVTIEDIEKMGGESVHFEADVYY